MRQKSSCWCPMRILRSLTSFFQWQISGHCFHSPYPLPTGWSIDKRCCFRPRGLWHCPLNPLPHCHPCLHPLLRSWTARPLRWLVSLFFPWHITLETGCSLRHWSVSNSSRVIGQHLGFDWLNPGLVWVDLKGSVRMITSLVVIALPPFYWCSMFWLARAFRFVKKLRPPAVAQKHTTNPQPPILKKNSCIQEVSRMLNVMY